MSSERSGGLFQHPLEAEDIEDNDAHEDAVVGKRSECMCFTNERKAAITIQATTNDTSIPIPSAI